MKSKHSIIQNQTIEDGILQGTINFPALNQNLKVELDLEADEPQLADFDSLIEALTGFTNHFGTENYNQFLENLSQKITDCCYEQSDYLATDDDYNSLQKDLTLVEILVFPEGFLLEYQAKNIFPNEIITVQLTEDYEIDDYAVND